MRALRMVLATSLTLAGAGAGAQQTVYFNDFEANTNGISSGSRIAYPAGCTSTLVGCPGFFLGASDGAPYRLGGGFVVNTGTLPTHTGLRISFDYLVLHSMDGSGFGPDGLALIGPSGTLLDATFSNWSGNRQSYCPVGPLGGDGLCDRWNGATEVNSLGFTFSGDVGSSLYRLSFDVAHTAPTAAFQFVALTNQDWTDEGMGFDNLRIQALGVSAVPEPATVALVGGGLLALAGIARRRRA